MNTFSKKNLVHAFTFAMAIVGMSLFSHVSANTASIDPSFQTGLPVGFDNAVRAQAVQSNGKILFAGRFSTYKGVPTKQFTRLNADGSIDPSFTIGGGAESWINTLAVDSTNKILVGGQFTDFSGSNAGRLVRLNSNGTVDSSFDIGNGFNQNVNTLAIQSGGKIIVGGEFSTYKGVAANKIIRLNTDGTRDTSFDIGNGFDGNVTTVAIQNDGKIIVGGYFTTYSGTTANRIIRLNTDGTIDSSFNIGNGFDSYVSTLLIQNNGQILVAGVFYTYNGTSANKLVRLNTDGTIDSSFGIGGGFNSNVYTLAQQSDGKIIAGGGFSTYNYGTAGRIVRLNINGSIDSSFVSGVGFDTDVKALSILSNGNILVNGLFTSYNGSAANKVTMINTDGSINSSFDLGDGFTANINTLVVQNDTRILVGGKFTVYKGLSTNKIIRLNPNGTKDFSFNIGAGFNGGDVYTLAVDSNEKILVGGNFWTYKGISAKSIIRLNTDGSIDPSFDISGDGFYYAVVYALAIQNDGKILVGGNFTTYKGVAANRIIRLNTDGSKDTSFDIGNGFNDYVKSLVIQSDGKILVGGYFTTYSGSTANYFIRLNADGSKDTSFDIGNGFNDYVNALAIDSDGKILVGGSFTSYSGSTANKIIRLNTDGTKDLSFNIGAGFGGWVNTLSIMSGNKILVGGSISSYNLLPIKNIVRLNMDGSRDSSFDVGSGFNSYVNAITTQNDGRIFIGGNFTTYQSQPVGYLTSIYGDSNLVILPNSTDTGDLITRFTEKGYTQSDGELIGNTAISLIETDGSVPLPFSVKNQDIKLSLPEDIQFKKADNVTNYIGIVSVPISKSLNSVNNSEVISAFKVGSSTETIKLAGGVATLLVPVTGETIGSPMNVYYSEDNGVTWYPQAITNVINISGQAYVSFTTNHFTDFAITLPALTGTFVINGDAASTTTDTVTLNISTTPAAMNMRFSNDGTNRSPREDYATTKANRSLSAGYGSKTVYAQFDADGDGTSDVTTSDDINYPDPNSTYSGNTECASGAYCGDLTLEVITGISYCQYGTTLDFGLTGHSYEARSLITGFQTTGNATAWFCEDKKGMAERSLGIQSSAIENISTHNPLHTIPASRVFIKNPDAYKAEGICTYSSGASLNQWTNIAGPTALLSKVGSYGEGCKIVTDNVSLRVDLTGSQAVGQYSGTITITIPNF